LPGVENERAALQAAGERLDLETDGAWVSEEVEKRFVNVGPRDIVLVDSATTKPQIDHLRKRFGSKVVHVHLTVPIQVLSERYRGRPREMREFDSYEELRRSSTEAAVESLGDVADVRIDTDRSEPKAVLARAVAGLGL